MKWPTLIILLCIPWLAFAQSNKLLAEHSALTSDCKSVRGHAQGIVSEASQSELNRDVALAQAEEVEKALKSMKERLETTKDLLSPEQLKSVANNYKVLEGLCADLQQEIGDILVELHKDKPDRIKVRNMAVDLRTKMKNGSAEHDLIKKKLGIP
jgi:uncharacterized protein (UPF0335 family)